MISSVLYLCVAGRNAAFLRLVRCRSLAEEYGNDTANKVELSMSHDFLFCLLYSPDCISVCVCVCASVLVRAHVCVHM